MKSLTGIILLLLLKPPVSYGQNANIHFYDYLSDLVISHLEIMSNDTLLVDLIFDTELNHILKQKLISKGLTLSNNSEFPHKMSIYNLSVGNNATRINDQIHRFFSGQIKIEVIENEIVIQSELFTYTFDDEVTELPPSISELTYISTIKEKESGVLQRKIFIPALLISAIATTVYLLFSIRS